MVGREHLHNLAHLAGEVEREQSVPLRYLPASLTPTRSPYLLASACCRAWLPPPQIFSGHCKLPDSGLCDTFVVSSPNMTYFEIVEAAKQRLDILVQVGLEYQYMPLVAKLIDIVNSGTPGQVRIVAIREHRFAFRVKVINWNWLNCNSGETLVEKCCHFSDLKRLFADVNPVSCHGLWSY